MKNKNIRLVQPLQNLLSSISKEYYLDFYLPHYKIVSGVNLSDRHKYMENTISLYKKHHESLDEQRVGYIKEDLYELCRHDEVIHFENILIYKELYKILFLIESTFNAQALLNDSKAYPTGFAKVQSDKKKINSFRHHEKKNLVGSFRLTDRKESRLRYWLTTLYFQNRNLTKFFLHSFIIADTEKIKALYDDEQASELILNDLTYFLMQKTSVSAVVKSLGILLYSEMKYFLGVRPQYAEVYMKSIIYKLFRENVNAYEFEKQVILRSSLGFFPVFGSSKKIHLKGNENQFIKQKLFRELKAFSDVDKTTFDQFFDSYMRTSHIQYLSKYPVELFRQNPKYSS